MNGPSEKWIWTETAAFPTPNSWSNGRLRKKNDNALREKNLQITVIANNH